MTSTWQNQPVTILGLSKSGIASATYLAEKGARVFLSEAIPASPTNKETRETLEKLGIEIEMGGHTSRCFDHSDLIIVSPGIPPTASIIQQLTLSGKTIISEVELAYREAKTPFIGITGTNGKTTTTTLISEVLTAAGFEAPACGNIGTPIINLTDSSADYFVAELSSFQLTFSPTLKSKVALLLNFKPDHLDWHGSVESYKQAKFSLFLDQHTPDWSILNAADPVCVELGQKITGNVLWFSRDMADVAQSPNWISLSPGGDVIISQNGQPQQTLLNVGQLKLVGKHNHENVMAAAATAVLLGIGAQAIADVATNFGGVEHRLEPVGTVQNITFYNDSKATNPDAALSALAAFIPNRVVLIAGGRDKKTDLSEFVASVKESTTETILIGEAAERFSDELRRGSYNRLHFADSLEKAVQLALTLATPQTPVLFSPACSSFDMFRNFEARGDAFKLAVQALMTVPA